ncbi:transposon Ty3-I Gag-Pol polyprotein, partial [Trichonephila inaurata madagascariensis]
KEENEALEQLHSEIKPDFSNHYVFCKCISENLILEKCSDIKSVIVRPGLIAMTWKGPMPIGKGFLKVLFAKPDADVNIIPADVVANAHIIAAYSVANGRYSSPFVVNCVPYSSQQNAVYNSLPISYVNMMTAILNLVKKYPAPNSLRYSNHVWVVDSKVKKVFLSIFEHYIPAVSMDLMLILQGKKPKLFSLYRFLDRVMDGTAPFTTRRIEFETENFRDLRNAVSREKSEVQDGKESLVAYSSKSLTAAENDFSMTEKEYLDVIWAIDTDSLSRKPLPEEVAVEIPSIAAIADYRKEQLKVYKRNYDPMGRQWLLVVPKQHRHDILKSLHDAPTAGHLGFFKTYDRIRRKYCWPGLYGRVRRYVSHCRQYQRRKSPPQLPPGQLHPIKPPNIPFSKIGIDSLRHFLVTRNGNRWTIVCTDYLTIFTFTKALPTAETIELAKF